MSYNIEREQTLRKISNVIDKDIIRWNNKHPGVMYTRKYELPRWMQTKK